MTHSGVEEDEQSAIKAIQKQFECLNMTLEKMNEHLARNEAPKTHRRQLRKRTQTPMEDGDELRYTEYEDNQHDKKRGGNTRGGTII